jgi:hypothetical protein
MCDPFCLQCSQGLIKTDIYTYTNNSWKVSGGMDFISLQNGFLISM